ncbi:MAG: HNH endonuclease [Pseudobdellovibrionaceae bacterium]
MNLNSINDPTLIERTEKLVRQERELLTTVLHHLREIDRRRLYSALGYKSLLDFAVRRLGYPEDQAYRRISAMKLLKEIPQIEEKINAGEISLTHIGLAQSLFRQEKKINQKEMSQTQKLSVLNQIANKPVREAERITLSLSTAPELVKPDRVNPLSADRIEVKFTARVGVQEKMERLKGWLAHQHPTLSLGELFEMLCDLGLKEWNPTKTAAPRKRRVSQSKSQAQIKREVFLRANNRCENCQSTYALEVDHIQPKALGGSDEASNLRLLCRACNQRAAIDAFGLVKMDGYLQSL